MPNSRNSRIGSEANAERGHSWFLALFGLSAALSLSTMTGCILFTPPTGICLGETSPCRSLENERAAAAKESAPLPDQRHEAPDFAVAFPGSWGILSGPSRTGSGEEKPEPILDQTDPTGLSTLRIAVGRSIPLQGGGAVSEGLRVITVNQLLADEQTPEAALSSLMRRSLEQNFTGEPEIFESQATLGGQPAYQVVMIGTGTLGGPSMRFLARSRFHRGRGYIVMLSVPEEFYSRANLVYDRILDGLEWRDADPTYPLPLETSPNPLATGSMPPAVAETTGSSSASGSALP